MSAVDQIDFSNSKCSRHFISDEFVPQSEPVHVLKDTTHWKNRTSSDANGIRKSSGEVFLIGIAGGSASGKTSVSERIIKLLNLPSVVLISMDSFYRALAPEDSKKAFNNDFNFDHPDAFEFPLLYSTLEKLKAGQPVDIPYYDFSTHSRLSESFHVNGVKVVIFEGILALYDKAVTSLFDMKIFVDTDADVRLSRRLVRDISERGRDLKGVLTQYNKFVKPSFDDFIQPTVRDADIIIPRGKDNTVAIDLIAKHIENILKQ